MAPSEKRDKGRAWIERIALLVVLELPKIEDTSGNWQRELPQQVEGDSYRHQRWHLGPGSRKTPCFVV